jgi:hypothetical protein
VKSLKNVADPSGYRITQLGKAAQSLEKRAFAALFGARNAPEMATIKAAFSQRSLLLCCFAHAPLPL